MKQILRYSFVALMAMVMGKAFAQEVTLDFTITDPADESGKTSIWGFPASSKNKTVEEKSFTYNGFTVKVAGSEGQGYYWHDKDHYLLFGKEGATLTLPAFDFAVGSIEIEGNSTASSGVKQNIFVGENAVSTETTGAQGTNIFEIAEANQAAGTIYTIKVLSNHNNQIKTIKIWKKGTSPSVTHIENTEETAYTVAEAIALIDKGESLSETVFVKGIVSQVDSYNDTYKSIQYWISDDGTTTNQFECYSGKGIGGADFASMDEVQVGAKVIVKGKLKKYNDIYEFDKNNELVKYEAPASGIQSLKTTEANAPIYNLAGQRVEKARKGLYIQNGKKFFVK